MLTELVELARHEKLTAEPGLKPKTVRWLLVFNPDGMFTGIQDLTGGEKKNNGRVFKACPDLTQQEMVAAGAGTRHFLVDQLDVVTLLTKDGEVDEKQAAKHNYFVGLLEQAADAVPQLGAIAAALRDPGRLATIRSKLIEEKAKPTELATFAIADVEPGSTVVLVEQDDWHAWWQSFRTQLAEQRAAKSTGGRRKKSTADGPLTMRCLLSGELVEPQPTHNKIEGLSDVGGLSMGDSFTSFDKDAFCSYGLSQGANAAMSEAMVKTYTSALNHLIRDRQRSYRLAGVKVIYWYSKAVQPEDDVTEKVISGWDFGDAENPAVPQAEEPTAMDQHEAENRAKQLLDAIRSS
ncbi:MAG: type I-C CRISPR-associated protein Cas8c/Csd1, partial [Planctomycetales bacterium]|nr:type I-C CRISPR-associated protein Cas8c/Csd1 [Planctomycetales bacterium]